MNSSNSQRIGFSIRGGGMKSVAYAGALKAFDEMGLKPSAMVTASGGTIVGASYALGYSSDEIFNHFKIFKPYSIFSLRSAIRGNFINYSTWVSHARMISKRNRVEELPIKLYIQATDVSRGCLVYIEEGDLAKAAIASSAVLTPFSFRHRRYIDGEYAPEYGINKLREFGCDTTIIIDLSEKKTKFSPLDIVRTIQIKALELDEKYNPADYKISIKIPPTFPFSMRNLESIYNAGYKQTLDFLRKI